MYDKSNIMDIIEDHQKDIDEVKEALGIVTNPAAKRALNNSLSYLTDNKRRYELQAKAWGLME